MEIVTRQIARYAAGFRVGFGHAGETVPGIEADRTIYRIHARNPCRAQAREPVEDADAAR